MGPFHGRGNFSISGAANCLPESLICCPNELLSVRIELQLFSGKDYFPVRRNCPNETDSAQLGGGGAAAPKLPASYASGGFEMFRSLR